MTTALANRTVDETVRVCLDWAERNVGHDHSIKLDSAQVANFALWLQAQPQARTLREYDAWCDQ